jgi:hypothetical protein
MSKRTSGLGRGLGELLDDNTPDMRAGRSATVVKKEGDSISIIPAGSKQVETKALFETKPKNRSVKS